MMLDSLANWKETIEERYGCCAEGGLHNHTCEDDYDIEVMLNRYKENLDTDSKPVCEKLGTYSQFCLNQNQYNDQQHPSIFPSSLHITVLRAQMMLGLVVLMYISKTVPDQIARVIHRQGEEEDSGVCKLNNLRELVWEEGQDTLWQKLGLCLDRWMNTVYQCVLYTINLYMLYNTDITDFADILYNSLAIEFIQELDEAYVSSSWYDRGYRYLKAGLVEMTIRRYLDLHDQKIQAIKSDRKAIRSEKARYGEAIGREEISANTTDGHYKTREGKLWPQFDEGRRHMVANQKERDDHDALFQELRWTKSGQSTDNRKTQDISGSWRWTKTGQPPATEEEGFAGTWASHDGGFNSNKGERVEMEEIKESTLFALVGPTRIKGKIEEVTPDEEAKKQTKFEVYHKGYLKITWTTEDEKKLWQIWIKEPYSYTKAGWKTCCADDVKHDKKDLLEEGLAKQFESHLQMVRDLIVMPKRRFFEAELLRLYFFDPIFEKFTAFRDWERWDHIIFPCGGTQVPFKGEEEMQDADKNLKKKGEEEMQDVKNLKKMLEEATKHGSEPADELWEHYVKKQEMRVQELHQVKFLRDKEKKEDTAKGGKRTKVDEVSGSPKQVRVAKEQFENVKKGAEDIYNQGVEYEKAAEQHLRDNKSVKKEENRLSRQLSIMKMKEKYLIEYNCEHRSSWLHCPPALALGIRVVCHSLLSLHSDVEWQSPILEGILTTIFLMNLPKQVSKVRKYSLLLRQ